MTSLKMVDEISRNASVHSICVEVFLKQNRRNVAQGMTVAAGPCNDE